jgi:SAM-dependent methyltransferase
MDKITEQLLYIREIYKSRLGQFPKYTVNTVKDLENILRDTKLDSIAIFDPVINIYGTLTEIDFVSANSALLVLKNINDMSIDLIRTLFQSNKISSIFYAIDNFMESPMIESEFGDDYIVSSDLENFPNFVVVYSKIKPKVTYNFKELFESSDLSFTWRIYNLVGKNIYNPQNRGFMIELVKKMAKNKNDDRKIYKSMREYYHKDGFRSGESSITNNHGIYKTQELMSYLPSNFKPRNFLDVGCGEGSITAEFGRELGLQPINIHGYDVQNVPNNKNFTFRLFDPDNNTPTNLYRDIIETGGFDIIAAQMCLHHIEPEHINDVLADIRKLLAPGGLFILKEHDCDSRDMHKLLDVLHNIYAIVWSKTTEQEDFSSKYEAYYQSKQYWEKVILKSGFKLVNAGLYKKPTFSVNNLHNPYHIYISLFSAQ